MSSETISEGKYVSLTYSISDENGNVVEQNDLPVGYIFGGDSELIGGMDQALRGRRAGEKVSMEVPPDQAFGPHDPQLTFVDDLENVPEAFRFVGAEVTMQNDAGETKTFYVTSMEDGKVTIDGNHPLAGKTLNVSVNILDVREPTAEDIANAGKPPAGSIN